MARILIVDDDDAVRGCLARILRHKGYRVDHVAHGGQAVARFAASPPDVILVDVNMPRLEGWEVCRQLRQQSRVPILMISSMAPPFAWKGAEVGENEAQTDEMNAYMPKSVNLESVLSWVQCMSRNGNGRDREPQARSPE